MMVGCSPAMASHCIDGPQIGDRFNIHNINANTSVQL